MDLIFDAPWWLYVVPAAIGVVMAYVGLKRADKTLRNVGVVAILIGVAVLIASKIIETDTEVVARHSKELVAAVERKDWATLEAFMEADAAVSLVGGGDAYTGRDQIVQACKSRVEGSTVTALSVTALDPKKESAALISAPIQIYVTADGAGGRPFPTEWRLDWAKGSDGRWLIREIAAIQIGNVRAADAPWFPKPR